MTGSGRRGALLALATVAALACGSCSSSTNGGSPTSGPTRSGAPTTAPGTRGSAAEKLVPAAIRSMGTLTVPSDADYPPFEFLAPNGKTITGLAADLMSGVMKRLGLRYKVQVVSFDSIIPGIQANRYQLSLAAENVTPERAKVVDFVTYDRGGDIFYGTTASSLSLAPTYKSICGHAVAVLQGSSQEAAASQAASSCPSGKAAHVLTYSTQNAVNLALQASRADFGIGSSALIGYLVKQTPGKFKTFSKAFNHTSVTGFAIKKGNGLAPAVQAALKEMIADGSYQAAFKKWGQTSDEIKTPQIVTK